MQDVARYWGSEYDWRRGEAKLNALPNFLTEIDGLDIHFIQVRSKHENALPLIVTHGWPGSVIEQLKIIGPLTELALPAEPEPEDGPVLIQDEYQVEPRDREAVLEAMKESMMRGERIELRGFGVFQVKPRKRGIGRNPRTGKEVRIPPGRTIRFKPGKDLQNLSQ